MDLRLGDCLEILKDIDDKSVDLVFADLPYGQVNCKWDCKIDLELLWKGLLRVAKSPSTPFFFTCTTKFGYELIKSNEKMFKYDLVWAKSNPCGFLQAKKQPMRKHEMLYVFYKKQPLYDISSHKHKFIKENESTVLDSKNYGTKDRKNPLKPFGVTGYEPPLPTSVLKEDCIPTRQVKEGATYGNIKLQENRENVYDPPLPTSVIKEEVELCKINENGTYGNSYIKTKEKEDHSIKYDPPLPTSVIKEDNCYNKGGKDHYEDYKTKLGYGNRKDNSSAFEPPLPTSVLEIKSIRLKQHSTAKPPDLMKWILKYYSKEGDVVLDPTMGSNPMGLACKEMNRNFIGIEKDPEIYDFACSRVD